VKDVLLFASESWTVTQSAIVRVRVLINKWLLRIVNLHRRGQYNHGKHERTRVGPSTEKKVELAGIQALRKSDDCIVKQSSQWKTQGQARSRRPKTIGKDI